MVKYPQVAPVALIGEDGNAFAIMGRVTSAMRRAGLSAEQISEYRTAATSGDYDNLLRVTMETVPVEDDDDDDDSEYDDFDSEYDERCECGCEDDF